VTLSPTGSPQGIDAPASIPSPTLAMPGGWGQGRPKAVPQGHEAQRSGLDATRKAWHPATQSANQPYVTIAVTMICPVCGDRFTPSGRRLYCSSPCRQAAWRRRQTQPARASTLTPKRPTVYQCVECDTRHLDERRCPDCNLFTRSLGPGAPCPHCDEPVAYTDLT